jgi:hypothetical protein
VDVAVVVDVDVIVSVNVVGRFLAPLSAAPEIIRVDPRNPRLAFQNL